MLRMDLMASESSPKDETVLHFLLFCKKAIICGTISQTVET